LSAFGSLLVANQGPEGSSDLVSGGSLGGIFGPAAGTTALTLLGVQPTGSLALEVVFDARETGSGTLQGGVFVSSGPGIGFEQLTGQNSFSLFVYEGAVWNVPTIPDYRSFPTPSFAFGVSLPEGPGFASFVSPGTGDAPAQVGAIGGFGNG